MVPQTVSSLDPFRRCWLPRAVPNCDVNITHWRSRKALRKLNGRNSAGAFVLATESANCGPQYNEQRPIPIPQIVRTQFEILGGVDAGTESEMDTLRFN
jgi:hypothetical protein